MIDFATSIILSFLSNNAKKYIIYTLFFFRNDHNRIDWLSIIESKSRSWVQVVEDGNDKLIRIDDVFQMDKLVDPYRYLHLSS